MPDEPTAPWYQKIKVPALIVVLVLAVVGGLGSNAGKDAYDWIRGKNKGKLEVLEVRVAGEPGGERNYNAAALARITSASSFPHIEFVLRNQGDKTATVRRVEIELADVWTLHDPYGHRTPSPGAAEPETPEFGAYGPNDVRVSPQGFVVPADVKLRQDVKAAESVAVPVTLRNIEDPSTREYVGRIRFAFIYDDGSRLQAPDVVVAFQGIGSYLPQYANPPPSFTPQTGAYDPLVAAANRQTAARIPAGLAVCRGLRVQYLQSILAPDALSGSSAQPADRRC